MRNLSLDRVDGKGKPEATRLFPAAWRGSPLIAGNGDWERPLDPISGHADRRYDTRGESARYVRLLASLTDQSRPYTQMTGGKYRKNRTRATYVPKLLHLFSLVSHPGRANEEKEKGKGKRYKREVKRWRERGWKKLMTSWAYGAAFALEVADVDDFIIYVRRTYLYSQILHAHYTHLIYLQ